MATSYKRSINVTFAYNGADVALTGNQAHQFINQFDKGEQIITVFDATTNTYDSYNRDFVSKASKVFSKGAAYVKPTCDKVF